MKKKKDQDNQTNDQPESGARAGQPELAGADQPDHELLETIDAGQEGAAANQVIEDPCHELREALSEKNKEFSALSDRYLRLMAEYDNFRRRSQKEKEALYGDCVAQVVKEWLPVVDNLDRASLAAEVYAGDEARKVVDGVAMIRKMADDILERLGVAVIPCCGQPFDPNLHDAVLHVEDDTVGASTVVEELQKGYRRDDRIIRHSVVKVAN